MADIPSGWYTKKYAMFFQNDGTLGIKLIVPQVEISILDFTSFPFFGSLLPPLLAFGEVPYAVQLSKKLFKKYFPFNQRILIHVVDV